MASSIPKPRASITAGQSSSPLMKVPVGSRVVLSRRRNGTVRYVGKLADESGEWYGVALDESKGDNDGTRAKERYFSCPPNHGVFVRRKEINYVKEPFNPIKSPPSPVTDESSSGNSNVSYVLTYHQGERFGPSASSEGLPSPLMKTFKGFRKELDSISLRTVGPRRRRDASPVASPASSTPSSPTAKSSLKPPSPLQRFSSFSQELPMQGEISSPSSPTSKLASPSSRRQSPVSLASKLSPARRSKSFRYDYDDDNAVRPVESMSPKSPDRLSSLRRSFGYLVREDGMKMDEPLDSAGCEEVYIGENTNDDSHNHAQVAPVAAAEIGFPDDSEMLEMRALLSSSRTDSILARPIVVVPVEEPIIAVESQRLAPATPSAIVTTELSASSSSQPAGISLIPALLDRTSSFRVPPIDISALNIDTDACERKRTPTPSPHGSPIECHRSSPWNSPVQDSDCTPRTRTTSLRMQGRSRSFRILTIDAGSPTTSPESSPSRRANSFMGQFIDTVDVLDDERSDGQCSALPSPRDDISEASAVSAPETGGIVSLQTKAQRSRQEHTTVESFYPATVSETDDQARERPLFFRRTHVGHSPMERRSSCSSFSPVNSSSSPPRSPKAGGLHNPNSTKASRIAELEREISAMRSSHENIVAVLRATNKQHAANVLELRAQVAALTEGNLWLERQLTAKGELVRELRELEQQHQRDSVSVTEVEKILEIKDAQIQTLEREMAQLRHRLARLESDKDSQLYQQFQHYEARRARDEKRINELRQEVVAMCNERLELQSEVRDLKEMSLRFF